VLFVAALAGGWMVARPGRPPASHRARPRALHAARPVPPVVTAGPATAAPPAAAATAAEAASAAPSASIRPGPAASGVTGARLAIIIDDCGQWPDIERALVALPVPLTMSIMPRAPYTEAIERDAAGAGDGIMLHLPMESLGGSDPGDGKVTTEMDDATIQAQVRDDLRRVPLARGVNNHEGSKATADARVMRDVAEVLASEGRYFIDSRTTAATLAARETVSLGVPTASRNVFLDNVDTIAAVEAQLRTAGDLARHAGWAIAIGHPKAATLAALRALIPSLEGQGVTFVLVQDLVGDVPSGPSS